MTYCKHGVCSFCGDVNVPVWCADKVLPDAPPGICPLCLSDAGNALDEYAMDGADDGEE